MTNVWASINEALFPIIRSNDNFTDNGVRLLVLLLLVFIVVKVVKKIMEGGAFRWVFIVALVGIGLGAYFINQRGEREVAISRLVERNGAIYEINSNRPFTGVTSTYYANGQWNKRMYYKNGKRDYANNYGESGRLLYQSPLDGCWVECEHELQELGLDLNRRVLDLRNALGR